MNIEKSTHIKVSTAATRTAVAVTLAGMALSPAAALASSVPSVSATSLVAPAAGAFVAPPMFGEQGYALAVYDGGNIDQLEAAAGAAGAIGVWVQDATGRYELLPVSGPNFLKARFAAFFPAAGMASGNGANSTNGSNGLNFPHVIAVTLVR